MFAVCYITQAQAIEVAGFNFTAIRIILLVGIARAFMKGELRELPPSPVDKWLIGYALTTLLIATVAQGSEVIRLLCRPQLQCFTRILRLPCLVEKPLGSLGVSLAFSLTHRPDGLQHAV